MSAGVCEVLGAEAWDSEDRPREKMDWLHGDSLKGLDCGPSCDWACVQEGAQVHH